MRYIKKFETSEAVQTALNNEELGNPYVALVGNDLDWNSLEPEPDYSTIPLTFEITGDGYINWKATNSAVTRTIEYSKNDGDWTEITSTTEGVQIPVVSGDTVQFRANNNTSYGTSLSNFNTFSGTTSNFNVKGNIMSLIIYEIFPINTRLGGGNYHFFGMFRGCTSLTDASKLILPATSLSDYCYYYMFRGCTSLTQAPSILPATTLRTYCYGSMFNGCSSLTTAPELPATSLASSCYSQMFQNCTSLVTAPTLPATTLTNQCYYQMFQYCSRLTQAPVLPATTLAASCYNSMFRGCTSLNYIKCLATNISASDSHKYWLQNVASTGTFITPSSTEWTTGVDGIPDGWTRVNSE